MNDLALFRSADEAVRWAWYLARHEPGIIGGPSYAKFIKRDEHERDETESKVRVVSNIQTAPRSRGLDAAAQAGLIKSAIEALPLEDRFLVKAKMLRSLERTEAVRALVANLDTYVPDVDAALMLDLLVRHYGKRGISIAALAKKHNIDRRKLTAIRRQVEITLDAISYRAETAAYLKLQRMGVVA